MNHQNDFQEQLFAGFVMNGSMQRQIHALTLEALEERISIIARPYVLNALVKESRRIGAEAWSEEAVQALSILLPEINVENSGNEVIEELQAALKSPSEPDDEEIHEHCIEVGNILATAWLQFLSIVLESKKELRLNKQLLPGEPEGLDPGLLSALSNSINSNVIDWETAQTIFSQLGRDLFKSGITFNLPLGISIYAEEDPDDDVNNFIVRKDLHSTE